MTQVYTSQNLNTLVNALNLSTQLQLLANKDIYEQALLTQKAAIICNNVPYMMIPQFISAINSTNLTLDAKTDIINNINKIPGSQLNTSNCSPITTIQQLENAFNPKTMMVNSQIPTNNDYVVIMSSNTFLNLMQSKNI